MKSDALLVSFQPYLTYLGLDILLLQTITLLFLILAFAFTNFLFLAAISNSVSLFPFFDKPLPTLLNSIVILFLFIRILLYSGPESIISLLYDLFKAIYANLRPTLSLLVG